MTNIETANMLLEKVTPLRTDCGQLCERCCCSGDEKTGMYLIPGEEKSFENKREFTIIQDKSGENLDLLVCNGTCDRELRPFACRIYPLFPLVVTDKGREKIKVIFDPRAIGSCPLCFSDKNIENRFIRAVKKAGKILIKDECGAEYLRNISDLITEIISLNEVLEKY